MVGFDNSKLAQHLVPPLTTVDAHVEEAGYAAAKQLVNLIKEANPKEIHIRISSSPILHPCYYGMDFPSKDELIANKFNSDIKKISDYLGVDSLEYMTIDEMLEAMVDYDKNEFCTACFSGDYPVKFDSHFIKTEYDD